MMMIKMRLLVKMKLATFMISDKYKSRSADIILCLYKHKIMNTNALQMTVLPLKACSKMNKIKKIKIDQEIQGELTTM